MYDQIMASGSLLQNAGGRRSEISLWVDKPPFMVEEHGWDKGSPVPTFQGQEDYEGGYSDHFPVGVRFAYLDAPAEAKPAPAKPAAVPAAAPKPAPAPVKIRPSVPDEAPRRAAPAPAKSKPAPAKPARSAPAKTSGADEPVVW